MATPTWSATEFPFIQPSSPSVIPVTVGGSVANVPADGSAPVTVTFSQPFLNQVNVVVGIQEGSTETYVDLFPRAFDVTLTGFKIYVTGGAVSSTTSVSWEATGF